MKNTKKIIVAISFFTAVNLTAKAQISNLSDISGTVLKEQSYFEVNGSPYSFDKWAKGDVKFENGKLLKDIGLKYDLVKDELLFLGKDGAEYYFNDPVKEFSLNYIKNDLQFNHFFKKGFPPFKNLTNKSYFEVLSDGGVKLLKKNVKTISTVKEYNSATTTKNIYENINYYILKQNVIFQIKKDDIKALAKTLDDQKSSLIIEFSKNNELNLKKEEDLKKVIEYFNTLNN